MVRKTVLALGLLLFSPTVFGQATSTESQTLQALLAEVHQLRQDLQTVSTSARRAQILIYRLYLQTAVVERASQRFDEVKSGLDQLEAQKKYQLDQIKSYEDMREDEQDATRRKSLDDSISNEKRRMEELVPFEQEVQTKKIQLEEQLRIEQAKLEQLQNELDQLDRTLMSTALQPASAN